MQPRFASGLGLNFIMGNETDREGGKEAGDVRLQGDKEVDGGRTSTGPHTKREIEEGRETARRLQGTCVCMRETSSTLGCGSECGGIGIRNGNKGEGECQQTKTDLRPKTQAKGATIHFSLPSYTQTPGGYIQIGREENIHNGQGSCSRKHHVGALASYLP